MTLITPEYKALLREYRKPNSGGSSWGGGGGPHVPFVFDLIEAYEVETIIDYGCGRGILLESLINQRLVNPTNVCGYDPGVEGREIIDREAYDLLVSTDVLEHIEPECLSSVLEHMRSLAPMAYLNIHTGPAKAILPDGRNAHLIQKPWDWWKSVLEDHYSSVERYASGRFGDSRPSFLCHA